MAAIKEDGKYKIKGKIKKDDGTYYNYKKIVPGAKKIGDARIYEADFLRQYQEIEKARTTLSFKELCDEYQNRPRDIKSSSIQTDRNIFEKASDVFGNKKINLITKEYLQKFILSLEEKYSKEYVKKYYYTISKVFDYAVDQDYLIVNPMAKVKRSKRKDEIKKEMSFWEPKQFKQFIDVIDDISMNAIFNFMYYMGTRKGETVALQWKDINLNTGIVRIYKTFTLKVEGKSWDITSPKTQNSIRNITMPSVVVEALKSWKDEATKFYGFSEECYVFGYDRPISYETLRRRFKNHIKKANQDEEGKDLPFDQQIPEIRIHDLRHSHASFLINNMSDKFTDFDIAKRLGDTVQTLHDTYAHWFKQADKGIIDFMNAEIG